jgi:hypothetical protein
MVNEEKYFDELQKIIGDIKSDDRINERWNGVTKVGPVIDKIRQRTSDKDWGTLRKGQRTICHMAVPSLSSLSYELDS